MNKTLFRLLAGLAALAVCIGLIVFLVVFHVDSVEIVGNTRNSEDEVRDVVLTGPLASNSFLLSTFKKTVVTDELPFVDSVEIEQVSPGKIRLHVNEKQIVGYVRYLDCNMYFDKDGLVVESEVAPSVSDETESNVVEPETVVDPVEVVDENETTYHAAVTDVPYITGLKFDSVAIDEKLPVENTGVFNTILGIARIVEKYDILPDQVEFGDQYEITLYYGSVRVMMGVDNLLEEKITRVAAILPKLSGKSGVLHMEDYTKDTVNIIFSEDVPEEDEGSSENTAETDTQEDLSDGTAEETSEEEMTEETDSQETEEDLSAETDSQMTEETDEGNTDGETGESTGETTLEDTEEETSGGGYEEGAENGEEE
ncbi:MAG: FtsQ-type POTRA domain-containing protein [Ruminococcus sp.]